MIIKIISIRKRRTRLRNTHMQMLYYDPKTARLLICIKILRDLPEMSQLLRKWLLSAIEKVINLGAWLHFVWYIAMPHALCVIIASFYDGVNTSCVYILCRRIAIKDLGEGRVDDLHRGIFASSNFLSDYTRVCNGNISGNACLFQSY